MIFQQKIQQKIHHRGRLGTTYETAWSMPMYTSTELVFVRIAGQICQIWKRGDQSWVTRQLLEHGVLLILAGEWMTRTKCTPVLIIVFRSLHRYAAAVAGVMSWLRDCCTRRAMSRLEKWAKLILSLRCRLLFCSCPMANGRRIASSSQNESADLWIHTKVKEGPRRRLLFFLGTFSWF